MLAVLPSTRNLDVGVSEDIVKASSSNADATKTFPRRRALFVGATQDPPSCNVHDTFDCMLQPTQPQWKPMSNLSRHFPHYLTVTALRIHRVNKLVSLLQAFPHMQTTQNAIPT